MRRLVAVWAGLVVATAATWWLAADHVPEQALRLGAVAAVVLTCVKLWLLARHLMDLRAAAVPLRRAVDAWVLLLGAALVALAVL
ncbi:cytochrome C oxidase subunit IV family protein [Pseudonocardia sp. NPDC049154]|uniref:cytochrome C oxidase subunit IV family protein n=1 Tax=Pseudonocardia sp. NPDC049154 TaxID=3155501 RepID=UPI0033DEDDDB